MSMGERLASLTPYQREVLSLMMQGKRYSEIGVVLGRSHDSIRSVGYRICRKLGAENRVQAVTFAIHIARSGGYNIWPVTEGEVKGG